MYQTKVGWFGSQLGLFTEIQQDSGYSWYHEIAWNVFCTASTLRWLHCILVQQTSELLYDISNHSCKAQADILTKVPIYISNIAMQGQNNRPFLLFL